MYVLGVEEKSTAASPLQLETTVGSPYCNFDLAHQQLETSVAVEMLRQYKQESVEEMQKQYEVNQY